MGQQEFEKLFAAGSNERRVAGQYPHHEAGAEIAAHGLRHLSGSQALEEVKSAVPLVIAVCCNALVNHIRDIHISPKTRPPLLIEAGKKVCAAISRFDRLSRNLASHMPGIDSKADALTNQGRAVPACITSQ